ncbi:hypothetical protein HYFRA_00013674 [Hymenoscyphus fraxineus]|uniref:Uncharacterized protein n=1 Tax=Hymenoscyphus fraxineus TaxID=746836 RepID=A0A9N9L9D7_9HELO|nr:hypothetical protein HYFRA_00013674 [Hymenoscyphus fraxineus]
MPTPDQTYQIKRTSFHKQAKLQAHKVPSSSDYNQAKFHAQRVPYPTTQSIKQTKLRAIEVASLKVPDDHTNDMQKEQQASKQNFKQVKAPANNIELRYLSKETSPAGSKESQDQKIDTEMYSPTSSTPLYQISGHIPCEK